MFLHGGNAMSVEADQDKAWQANYDARKHYFEKNVGPLPADILKMLNMMGVWPGGGLFVIPADKIGPGLAVYTTFGLTNPDMPTSARMTGFDLKSDGTRATQAGGSLQPKPPAAKRPGAAGYGYEILMVAQKDQRWPLGFLQWAANAEIGNDVGLLARVEKYDGLTVEQIDVGDGKLINILIAKSLPPLPSRTNLPAGTMDILVAVVITDEEMQWSMKNGRSALLKRLVDGGVGQVSRLGRPSVVH
jgi:hypothetical protein